MTGNEILALARASFGERSELTVLNTEALEYLNSALQELYNDLPPERMKERLVETAVVMAANRGPITNTWDRVVEVYVNDKPAIQVPKEVIQNADYGNLFTPSVGIFHLDNSYVWVRPSGTVKIVHLTPPAELVTLDLTAELAAFSRVWHPALAHLVTSYMYAQEEDQTQAQHYRGEYSQQILGLIQQMSEEESQ